MLHALLFVIPLPALRVTGGSSQDPCQTLFRCFFSHFVSAFASPALHRAEGANFSLWSSSLSSTQPCAKTFQRKTAPVAFCQSRLRRSIRRHHVVDGLSLPETEGAMSSTFSLIGSHDGPGRPRFRSLCLPVHLCKSAMYVCTRGCVKAHPTNRVLLMHMQMVCQQRRAAMTLISASSP